MEKIRELIPKDLIIEQLLLVVLVIVIIKILTWGFKKGLDRASRKGLDRAAIPLVSDLFKYTLYVLGLLLCLNILGVNTNGLLAMIGAASLAVGLALKDTLSNVASGILLLFLSPFKAGDYIECGDVKGKIGGIGLFNTTFETMDGLYVSAPNSSLWGAPIVNYSRNMVRRLDLTVSVSYETSLDVAFCVLRKMVNEESRFLKLPPAKIFVEELADSGVNISIWVWVRTYEYQELQRKYLGIIKNILDEKNIEIPYPQRVVHIRQEGGVVATTVDEEEDDLSQLSDPDTLKKMGIHLGEVPEIPKYNL
ncbi:mechanosensitive ion channel family protein [Fibrobacter sp. UWEL]|uniref:mechanosensitive ion channel family protein n=1 Tax=Fibrobacter sp. UWEL TaxID=1896209 RepID=UPI0009189E48|nr:mechanosensitive ion channel family protein [Fibrobacter sp. UWEL]SHK45442.1 small conductance mechanosensitive channel [Fibrobacter sp. UWEL]